MKLAVIIGWALLAIEGLLVATMFVQKNMGDDAAGRGVARGFAMVLAPVLIVAAALFIWGQRGGPRAAFWAGFGVMAIPLTFMAWNTIGGTLRRLDLAAGKSRYGRFDDHRLTKLARAIERDDTAAVRAILAEGPVDFTARSRRGRTIFGRAVEHTSQSYESEAGLESVRLLLAAGATPIPNAIEPEFYRGDLDAHLLVAYVFGGNSRNTIPLLDMLLSAGADANMRNYEGQPLYFSTYMSRPKLEVLAKHGADFTAPDTTRTDRVGWTAAMFAAQMGQWDAVSFLLDHGVRGDVVAPDGTSLATIIAEKKSEGDRSEAMAAVKARLVAKTAKR